jgi:hypothetical protein
MRSMNELDSQPLPAPPPAVIVRAALWLQRALLAAARRLLPPEAHAADIVTGLAWSWALGAIVRADVPDALGDETLSAQELAPRVGLDPDMLHRSLRSLATRGLFWMETDGRFRNNPATHALRHGHPGAVRDFVLYFTGRSNVSSWEAFEWTLRTGDSAFQHVHGMNVWEWFDRHPEERETFARAMTGLTLSDTPVIARLYPFGDLRVLCDVGGGRGLLLSEILIHHPRLKGILCDAPGVLASAEELLRARGVSQRVSLAPGSFFEQVPRGADGYLLKNILHDWDDETCLILLRVIRSAVSIGARLLVVETVVARISRDPIGTASDMQMAVACARGRERDVTDFHRLFSAAGFAPGRVFNSPLIAVLEATASPP